MLQLQDPLAAPSPTKPRTRHTLPPSDPTSKSINPLRKAKSGSSILLAEAVQVGDAAVEVYEDGQTERLTTPDANRQDRRASGRCGGLVVLGIVLTGLVAGRAPALLPMATSTARAPHLDRTPSTWSRRVASSAT